MANKSLYVRSNYQVNQTPQFKVLSSDQCEETYLSALEILERTGADVFSEEALSLFANGGCWVEGNRVRFPSHIVEMAVQTVPSRVVISNRKGERSMFLEAHNIFVGPDAVSNFVIDPLSGERRKCARSDNEQAAVVCDALHNIDFATGIGVCSFGDLVKNTTKPIIQKVAGVKQCSDILNIATAVTGSDEVVRRSPFFMFQVESTSPLSSSGEAMEQLVFAGKNRVPVIYSTQTFAGDLAPETMAGSLAMALADCLVGLVANQLAEAGAPFIMGGLVSSFDQKSNNRTYGGPEHGVLSSALVDICRYLHIPNFITGGSTDAKILDAQGSLEVAFSLLSGGLSGANIIQGCNVIESGNTTSLDLLVMSDEIMGMVKRILRGIDVNDDTMAVDVVDEVGPGGHFLGSEHTIMNFRSETWWPTLLNRKRYDEWRAGGMKTMGKRTNEKTQSILQNHQPEPLPEETITKINELLAEIEKQGCAVERRDSHEN